MLRSLSFIIALLFPLHLLCLVTKLIASSVLRGPHLGLLFILYVLFNDTVSCQDYKAFMIDEWMNMEHWWNDMGTGKLKYWEKNLSHYHFIYSNLSWTSMRCFHLDTDRSLNIAVQSKCNIYCIIVTEGIVCVGVRLERPYPPAWCIMLWKNCL